MRTRLFVIGIILFFFSCGKKEKKTNHESVQNITYDRIVIDTVCVDIPNSSFNGFSGVYHESIYFLDRFFGYFYEISLDGEILDRHMGIGRAANEIPIKAPYAAVFDKNKLLLLGGTYDSYLFTNLTNRTKIDIKVSETSNTLEDSRVYTSFSEILRMNGDGFFYNIYSESTFANPVEHSNKYFNDAHIIMQVNIKTGEAKPLGHYSEYYHTNHGLVKHLFGINYDIDQQGNFIVSYQTDSLIYMYNNNFEPISIFGFEGKEMKKDYTESLPLWDDFNQAYKNDIKNKGYYYWLEHIEEGNYTFRSYQKDGVSEVDGLQIYKNNIMIADVCVPRHFKVIGYIAPFFFTQIICDEQNESMKFYKFRLE